MLVTFEVRGGRLSGWTQSACAAGSPPVPPPYPGRAQPDWVGFARQAAELAALLAG